MPMRTVPVDGPLDLRRTLAIHQRGPCDPTMRLVAGRIVRATRTADGPATVALRTVGGAVEAEAWGPGPFGLRLLPEPSVLAAIPYYALHPIGVERRRADLVRRVADRAARFEEILGLARDAAYARLTALPGLGPWTAAEVMLRAAGDPDAVSVGDFHLPNLVAFTLAGEIRGTNERMLELLEPWRGHRARVIRLLETSGLRPPAFGPRY